MKSKNSKNPRKRLGFGLFRGLGRPGARSRPQAHHPGPTRPEKSIGSTFGARARRFWAQNAIFAFSGCGQIGPFWALPGPGRAQRWRWKGGRRVEKSILLPGSQSAPNGQIWRGRAPAPAKTQTGASSLQTGTLDFGPKTVHQSPRKSAARNGVFRLTQKMASNRLFDPSKRIFGPN